MAGTSLGSSPLVAANTSVQYFQVHSSTGGSYDATKNSSLPNHYPLVTREGVVPVHELSQRGLYRQARYAGLYGPVPGAGYDTVSEAAFDRVAQHYAEDRGAVPEEHAERAVAPAVEYESGSPRPLALADGPIAVADHSGT